MANKKHKLDAVKDNQLLAPKKEAPPAGANDNLVDEISENFDRFETWVIENGKYILGACIAVIVIVAIVFIGLQISEKSKQTAMMKLAQAEKIADLEKILGEVSASAPGYDAALIRLAGLYKAEKKYDKAFDCYQKVAAGKTDAYLSCRALLDSAYMQELAGKKEQSAAIFASVADSAGSPVDLRAEGAYAAGRIFYALKNTAQAKKYLGMMDPVKATTQQSAQWASLAKALLNRIAK